jgi:hypothetical protein
MAGFADDVAAAIERAGYLRAHVVGLSMGGVVALELLPPPPRARPQPHPRQHLGLPGRRRGPLHMVLRTRSMSTACPASPSAACPASSRTTTAPEIVRAGVAVESAKDEAMVRACWREMLRADLRPLLPTIDRAPAPHRRRPRPRHPHRSSAHRDRRSCPLRQARPARSRRPLLQPRRPRRLHRRPARPPPRRPRPRRRSPRSAPLRPPRAARRQRRRPAPPPPRSPRRRAARRQLRHRLHPDHRRPRRARRRPYLRPARRHLPPREHRDRPRPRPRPPLPAAPRPSWATSASAPPTWASA